MNEKTVLGYVSPGEVSTHFMQSVIDIKDADYERGASRRRIVGTISEISGPRIAHARNLIVNEFLKTDAAWLLMLDTDMVFSYEAFERLFEAAHPREFPIVGGLCFGGGRSGVIFPTLYVFQEPEKKGDPPVRVCEDYPDNARCEVDATGAAFLLMHRDALTRIGQHFAGAYPWFIEGSVYHGCPFGEDWAFCLRAKQLGYPIYVHTGVKVGHIKPQILDESVWESYQKRKAEIGELGIEAEYRKQVNG